MKNYINFYRGFDHGKDFRQKARADVSHSLSRCTSGAADSTYYKTKNGWLKYHTMSTKGHSIDEKDLPPEVLKAYKRSGLHRLEDAQKINNKKGARPGSEA